MCGISPLSGPTVNDDSMILFYLCLLYFSVLFRVSFTNLLFPVLLVFYTDLPTKAKRPAYPLEWVWFEPSLYLFMERS
jgi:hypothetical protein